MKNLILYTRETISEEELSVKVAHSMHLAVLSNGELKVLNHNSGVLFGKATENADGSLNAKCLEKPVALQINNFLYGVVYIISNEKGEPDEESKGKVAVCITRDFAHYSSPAMWNISEEFIERIFVSFNDEKRFFEVWYKESNGKWFRGFAKTFTGDLFNVTEESFEEEQGISKDVLSFCENGKEKLPEGMILSGSLEIDDETADYVEKKLITPVNITNIVPESVIASQESDVTGVKAVAEYSDGSQCQKFVDWDLSTVDFEKEGEYRVTGKVHKEHFPFPIFENRADPCIGRWNGKYYFIATTDEDGNHSLYIREADSVKGLMDAKPVLLLDSNTYDYIGGLLWAPEFHEVEGKMYIYFAAAFQGEFLREESRVMELKEGGNPVNPKDWSAPIKVLKPDGTPLAEETKEITLDMTVFMWEDEYYAVWSQRQFVPKDLGAWLYMAKLDKKEPWKLASEPFVLTKPEYSFENNHTYVAEGPFALIRGDKLYLTYSGALVDSTYIVNMLSLKKGQDIMNPREWTKNNYPLLCARSTPGEYGTGHNAYVIDDDGTVWNSYHARPGVNGPRSTGIRRVHFGMDGEPILDMQEELDVKDEIAAVSMKVYVKK